MTHRKKQCQKPLFNYFPKEIIIEILSNLHVKSLIRFKSVTKAWCCLISDPHFIRKHVRVLDAEDTLERRRALLRYPLHSIKSCSLHSIYHEPFGYSINHDFPMKNSDCKFKIVGSCNGLVCLCVKAQIEQILFLWDPCTRESIRLMSPGTSSKQDYSPAVIQHSFGYNQESDDYIVVKLIIIGAFKPQVKLYSLRFDTWRDIDGFPFEIHHIESSKFVSGAVTWGVLRSNDNSWSLVSLELAKETFVELPQPNYGDGAFCPMLGILEGCFSVLCKSKRYPIIV